MNEITNKHLLIAILIIGMIIIGLLIPLQNKGGSSYSYQNNNLGATAYNADYSGSPSDSFFNFGNQSRYPYQPTIIRTYNNPTIDTTSTTTHYYTTTTQQNSNANGYYDVYGGYVPPGCDSGTDYSLTTGEPCG